MRELNKYHKVYNSYIDENIPNIFINRFLKGKWAPLEMEPMEGCTCTFCYEYYHSDIEDKINNVSFKDINSLVDSIYLNLNDTTDENLLWEKLYSLDYNDNLSKIIKITKKSLIDKKISFSDIVGNINI